MGYIGSDWASDVETHKNTYGYAFFLDKDFFHGPKKNSLLCFP